MDCSACKNNFTSGDKIIQADCGCCVHLFKSDCATQEDYCQKCSKNFKIHNTSPVVSFKARELSQSDEKKKLLEDVMEEAGKMMHDKVEEVEKKYADKFEEQRKINLEMMKKLAAVSKSQENLMNLFVSHTKVLNQEMVKIKGDIINLQEDVEEINEELGLDDDYEEAEDNIII